MMKSMFSSRLLASRRALGLRGGMHAYLSVSLNSVSINQEKNFSYQMESIREYVTDEVKNEIPIDLTKILEQEPIQRTPLSAIYIPNLFTHRFLPSEKHVNSISNKDLAKEIFRVREVPLTVDVNHAGDKLIDKNGLPYHKYIQKEFLKKDISEYELYLDEFEVELNRYKQGYLSRLSSALKNVDILKLPKDIQALVPAHFSKTAKQLKLERIESRKTRKLENEKIQKKKKGSEVTEEIAEEEESAEAEVEAEEAQEEKTSDGIVASRTNLRLSYRDNYRVPRLNFEDLRKELQLLKLMDNDNSPHRQYMIQCNLHIQSKHEVIVHSLLTKSNLQLKKIEPPKTLEILREPSRNNSTALPLEGSGIQVNFSSIGKQYLQSLIKKRGSNEDFMTIIDVRSRIRAFDCRIPGAVNIPLREILKGALRLKNDDFLALYGIPKIPQGHTLIFYSDHEKDAIMASALAFLNFGYKNVLVYKGGVADWYDYGFQPMWARYEKTAAQDLNREDWLQFYGRNRHHNTQAARQTAMLNRFLSERLPEDVKTLRMLNKYAKERMSLEKDQPEESNERLPFIGQIDLYDGVSSSLLYKLTREKLQQLSIVMNPSHSALKIAHEYHKYYGANSQRTQL